MGKRKPTRREVFLQLMERVIPWDLLLKAIVPYYPKAGPQGGRPAYPIEVMLRIYFLQNWYGYADLSMEEALYEVLCRFAKVRIERIGVDAASGLVHHVVGTAAHVSDVTVAHHLLQGDRARGLCRRGLSRCHEAS